jgi:hypothetical protein
MASGLWFWKAKADERLVSGFAGHSSLAGSEQAKRVCVERGAGA